MPVSARSIVTAPGPLEGHADLTLAERAFRLVRDDILNGRLAPDARLRIHLLQQR